MEWDDFADGWDQQPGVHEYAAAAFASLRHTATSREFRLNGARACDFGCGTGLLTEHLVGLCRTIDAVDVSPRMLEVLDRKRTTNGWDNVRLATTVPEGARYDLVVCSSALAFVDDYAATVQFLAAHLDPGGLFVQWDWEFDPEDDHGIGFRRDDVTETLRASGLQEVDVATAFEVLVEGQQMAPLVGSGVTPA